MFEGNTYPVILERMLARVPDKLDKREGSVIWDTHSPTALELQFLYIELERIIREAYGDTASREFLILRCRERGITPYPATNAILKGEFSPPDVEVEGKRFNLGELNYTVREKMSVGVYRVQCDMVGITGNQHLGMMLPIDYVVGLESAELTEVLIPGEDEEDTEDLRQRYFDSFQEKAFGGNVRDYLEKTNAIPGVGKTKVTRVWNSDISPARMIPAPSVRAWYEETAGTLEGEVRDWLDGVYTAAASKKLTTGGTVLLTILDSDFGPASDTLIQTVQTAMDPEVNAGEGIGLAPIGHVVTVQSAEPKEIAVKAELTFDAGYSWGNLAPLIGQAVEGYLLELRKMWADTPYLIVRISQIEARILEIPGILDIQHTRLNDAEENLVLTAYQIPVLGGVGA